MIHLDTNFLIDALVPGSPQEAKLLGWLTSGESIGISAVAWGEFLCGPLTPAADALARQLLPAAEPIQKEDAERAARLFNQTGRRSKAYADCCIASVAIRIQGGLATSNGADFQPMTALGLVLA